MITHTLRFLALATVLSLPLRGQITSISVDAGSPFGDNGFTGGSVTSMAPVAGVTDVTFRFGNFSYDMLVDPGSYLVTFTWVEQTVQGPGGRKFRVTINDQVFFDQLDLYTACGYLKECSRTVLVVNTSPGGLHITFTTQVRNAIVSRIDVAPALILTSVKNCIAVVGPVNCKNLVLAAGVGNPNVPYIMFPATPEMIGAMVWK